MTKLVDIPNKPAPVMADGYSDSEGNLTSPTASMVSDRYGVVNGQLRLFRGDGTNLVTDSADLEAASWTHTVTVHDATTFTATAKAQVVIDSIASSDSNYYCISFKARVVSGAADTNISIYHFNSPTGSRTLLTNAAVYKWDSTNNVWDSDTSAGLTTTLERYYMVVEGKSGGGNLSIGLHDNNASGWQKIEFTEVQVENLGNLTTAPGPELIADQVDRDFSGASDWTNTDINAYDETGDLTITANAIGQFCTLAVSEAPMTTDRAYTLEYDCANIVGSWTVSDFDGGFTIGTINANGTDLQFNFVYDDASSGGIRITSVDNNSSADLDNFSLKETTLVNSEPSTYTATSGGTASIPAAIPLTDDGLQFDGEGTNLLPYSDDFTQWTTSNITDTADQEGPDGVTNSATSLLATAANGTILYDLDPLASTDYYFTIWMKRITGTGNIQLTDDNGSNWATKTLSSSWQRFGVTRSQANPHVGIRIVTDTDKIAVFRGQVEATPYYSSSIPTNGTPVTRTTMAQDSSDNGVQWTISTDLKNILTNGGAGTGTLITEVTPCFNEGDVATDQGILNTDQTPHSLLKFEATNDTFQSYDGSNGIDTNPSITAQTQYLVAVTWTVSSTWRIGFSSDGGANWTWDSDSQAMDAGGYSVHADNEMKLSYGNSELPFYLGRIRIWDKAYTTAEIERGIVDDDYMGMSLKDGFLISGGFLDNDTPRFKSIKDGKLRVTKFRNPRT